MRNILLASVLLMTVTLYAATAAGPFRDEEVTLTNGTITLTGHAVNEVLRHHAALLAAIKEGSTEETLISLGRSLMAAGRWMRFFISWPRPWTSSC